MLQVNQVVHLKSDEPKSQSNAEGAKVMHIAKTGFLGGDEALQGTPKTGVSDPTKEQRVSFRHVRPLEMCIG